MLYFHIFSLLWFVAFFEGATRFVYGSSVANWYFRTSYLPVATAYFHLVRYHIGSVAFGSLLIALVWAIQIVVEFIHKNFRSQAGNNQAVGYIFALIQCCLTCFERFIEFINQNAYVLIAMEGTNFCTAAKDAFSLILRNAGTFAALSSLGAIFQFVGQLLVAAATGVAGFYFIT